MFFFLLVTNGSDGGRSDFQKAVRLNTYEKEILRSQSLTYVFLPPPPFHSKRFFPNAKKLFKNHCQPQLMSVHHSPRKE